MAQPPTMRRLGHDVVDTEHLGLANRGVSDSEILVAATDAGRAVLTLDRGDCYRLHRARDDHAGIIACTQDVNWTSMATRIDAALASVEHLRGQYIRVVRPGPAPS